MLAGLRAPADAAALLRALAVAQLAPLAAELEAADQALAALSRALTARPDLARPRSRLVDEVVAA